MKFDFGNFGGFNQDGDSGEYRWTPPKKDGGKPKKARRALSKGKATVISLVITIVFALLYFYFQLPALNIHSGDCMFSSFSSRWSGAPRSSSSAASAAAR